MRLAMPGYRNFLSHAHTPSEFLDEDCKNLGAGCFAWGIRFGKVIVKRRGMGVKEVHRHPS